MELSASGQGSRLFVYVFSILITPDTIYANWDMLIGSDEQDKPQYWRGLAGSEKPENRAVFYNIYMGKDPNLEIYPAKVEHTARVAS